MNKKKVKINFKYFWPGFDKKDNLFVNLLMEDYDVEISDNPDYLFFSVFSNEGQTTPKFNLKHVVKNYFSTTLDKVSPSTFAFLKSNFYKPKTYAFPEIKTNAVKIFYTEENVVPEMEKCDWAFSFEYDEEFNNLKHMRLPCYVFHSKNFGEELIKTNNLQKSNIQIKPKFCNFIYSAQNSNRENFFKKLSKYKRIDSPGKRLNNSPPIGQFESAQKSRAHNNWPDQKIEFLKDYKFTIAFENNSRIGYTTEKIYHPMTANSIPIYWGNPKIERDFNTKSFINAHEYKNLSDLVERIIEIDNNEDLYYKYLREPWFNNNSPSKYFNKERLKKRLAEIIEYN